MATALHPQTILATKYAREPITDPFGFPLRLRTATKLGFKNPKWITAIEVTNDYPRRLLGGPRLQLDLPVSRLLMQRVAEASTREAQRKSSLIFHAAFKPATKLPETFEMPPVRQR